MTETETRAEQVYDRIRSDILSGLIKPGAPLPFAQLKSDYGASMGVLREALTRLAAEGLANNRAQHGFRVMEVSLDDLADLTAARCLIEATVLKDSVARGDLEWEARIIAAHHRMERTPKGETEDGTTLSNAWARTHHDFHVVLCSAAKSNRLLTIADSLRASAEVYRRWSMPLEVPKRDVTAEHRELLDLCLAHKAEAAAEALRTHLRRTQSIILDGSKVARN